MPIAYLEKVSGDIFRIEIILYYHMNQQDLNAL